MGKRSRRKKPAPRGGGAVHSNLPPATVADSDFPPGSQFVLNRFRQPTDEFYGLKSDEYGSCLRVSYDVAKLITDRDSSDYAKELQNMFEFIFLVAFPAKEEFGFEAALNIVKKWPRMRLRWRRLRRRVCDYCGRRNDLSEPRLWVCAGCGVARYCDETCQALDFSHHAQCCPVLARRWDGAGSMPLKLFDLCAEGKWDDPAVLPSARARKFLRERLRKIEDANLMRQI